MKRILKYSIVIFVFLALSLNSKLYAQMVEATVSLTGSVFNAITKEPVTVFIVIIDENNNRITAARSNASEDGYYFITGLKPGKKYYVAIAQKNYFKEKFAIDIPNTDKYTEISHDYLVIPMEQGIKIKLPVPPFERHKTKLRVGADELLSDMANTMTYNPDVKFQIECYPDGDEKTAENKELTEGRCKALLDYFTSKGIDASRISIKPSATVNADDPPPTKKMAKGKRYIGPTILFVKSI